MNNHIFLIGFMGSGKSTIGPILAREIKQPFHDLDKVIETEQNTTIKEIFATKGESFFRELESHSLVQSRHLDPCVMALGGGAFVSDFNRTFIAKHGVSIWLKVPLQLAKTRCKNSPDRPLAKNLDRWESLFQVREMHYSLADIHIEVEWKSPSRIAAEIQERLEELKRQ
ncbi:MAG: shikimate kinase [Acidobacteriota bacterium]